jgi:hypothetical protein
MHIYFEQVSGLFIGRGSVKAARRGRIPRVALVAIRELTFSQE